MAQRRERIPASGAVSLQFKQAARETCSSEDFESRDRPGEFVAPHCTSPHSHITPTPFSLPHPTFFELQRFHPPIRARTDGKRGAT